MNDQTKPKISIIVPVFCTEKYLPDCIESLIGQTYDNIEIILVDDGSTDRSGEICDRYAALDERITVIHKENGGVSSARNIGLDRARGEWISFVDADDTLERDAYDYLIQNAEKRGADLIQCPMFVDEGAKSSVMCAPEREILVNGASEANREFFKYFSGGACCKLFKRETVDGIRFDTSLTIGEDMRYNVDALARSKCALLCTEPKYHYLQRNYSACNSVPTRDRLTSYDRMLSRAEIDFADIKPLVYFVKSEKVKNAMHVCSQIVRFQITDCNDVFEDMQKRISELKEFITKENGFTAKERFKARLITRHTVIYKFLIRKKK